MGFYHYNVVVRFQQVIDLLLIRFKNKGTNTESEVLRGYAHKYIGEIIKLLGEVPADLLLVLKTNDCLRHLDKALGAPINSAIGSYIHRAFSSLSLKFILDYSNCIDDFVCHFSRRLESREVLGREAYGSDQIRRYSIPGELLHRSVLGIVNMDGC